MNFDEFGGNNSEKVSYDKPYYEERDSLERQPMRASRGEPYRYHYILIYTYTHTLIYSYTHILILSYTYMLIHS